MFVGGRLQLEGALKVQERGFGDLGILLRGSGFKSSFRGSGGSVEEFILGLAGLKRPEMEHYAKLQKCSKQLKNEGWTKMR